MSRSQLRARLGEPQPAFPEVDIERPGSLALHVNERTKPQRRVGPAPFVEPWKPANPWTDDYLERELASVVQWMPEQLTVVADEDKRHVILERRKTVGNIAAYMREDFLEWGPFPWLQIDGHVWMSITPMEIESHYMPIFLAEGRVGVGGLGLGYAAVRMASKPEVREVVVYENNPLVLRLWEKTHRHISSAWLSKITIVDRDVAKMRDESFDLFYNDVYQRGLDPLAITHWATLPLRNEFGNYHWWTMEAWLAAFVFAQRKHEVPFFYRHTYFPFLRQFFEAVDGGHGIYGKVGDYRHVRRDANKLPQEVWNG